MRSIPRLVVWLLLLPSAVGVCHACCFSFSKTPRANQFSVATTDFPSDRLHPCPADWAQEDWDRYQEALISGFKGCMSRCCGYSNCYTNPSGLKQCQDHCIEMGEDYSTTFYPKTQLM